jgi:hypothetical protein
VAFTEDTAPLFTDFAAASCTIGGVAVSAIFSNRAQDALLAAGAQPQLTVKSADVSTTARGAAVVVNGTNYTVAKVEHDGTGLARVLLEKA